MKKEVPTAVETVNNGKANRQDANKISIYKVKPAKLTAYKRKSFNVNHPKVHLIIYNRDGRAAGACTQSLVNKYVKTCIYTI